MTVPEAELMKMEVGLIPQGEGWFVLNARDASWIRSEERGQDTDFEGEQEWTQLGFRIQVLSPRSAGYLPRRERPGGLPRRLRRVRARDRG